jgi:hypothetical protein
MAKLRFTPERIVVGGVYNIRYESEYEALGYHIVDVMGEIPGYTGYWRITTE